MRKVGTSLIILLLFLLGSCAQEPLIGEVFDIAELQSGFEWVTLKSGKEEGFLEPLMKFEVYRTTEQSFKQIQNHLSGHLKRIEPGYYLNNEFDDFLMGNGLKVLNANSSMISSNPFDDHYRVYFLSDSQTIAVLWINSN
ncbi:hypothetical protein N9W65_01810 [Schleiferiaceae bacterium]|nr:hypothetical protein [Schleiferiaceae bacterium]